MGGIKDQVGAARVHTAAAALGAVLVSGGAAATGDERQGWTAQMAAMAGHETGWHFCWGPAAPQRACRPAARRHSARGGPLLGTSLHLPRRLASSGAQGSCLVLSGGKAGSTLANASLAADAQPDMSRRCCRAAWRGRRALSGLPLLLLPPRASRRCCPGPGSGNVGPEAQHLQRRRCRGGWHCPWQPRRQAGAPWAVLPTPHCKQAAAGPGP